MTIFTGINENDGQPYSFHTEDIRDFIGDTGLSEKVMPEIARVLACNVEVPTVREDGTVEICAANFNDSYLDIEEELMNMYQDYGID
jgi:hypothetical protein